MVMMGKAMSDEHSMHWEGSSSLTWRWEETVTVEKKGGEGGRGEGGRSCGG